jgi:pantetheine-phosphate adenylyltransferase
VTVGHVDVISRAAALYDEVVVAVLHNPAKSGTLPVEQRLQLLKAALADVPNLRIEAYANTLLVDVCRDLGAQAIVKGLRSGTDFAYDPRFEHVSSSLVKEVAALGGDITGLVDDETRAALLARLRPAEGS